MQRTRTLAICLLATACQGKPDRPQATPAASAAPVATSPAWTGDITRSIAEDQRQPQAIAGGFALHAGALHARLDASGIEVADGGWRFDYAGDLALPEIEGSRVVYRRGAGVTEWYEARPEGIEQGFTVSELPADGGDLIVRGRVESNESGRVEDDGVVFGELRYAGLAVFDAAGRPLHASIEWDAPTRMLALRVPADQLAGAELPIVIDPLLSTATWTVDPTNQATARFGYSVAGAGDVNGDGYADVVVGAYAYDNGQTDEGRAYLYLGSATGLATTPAWTAESDQAVGNFGVSVAAAGDVNGDGYGDVVVGAHAYDNVEMDEGRVYLYLGSATALSTTAAWTAEPNQPGANFGVSVASAGDVNGDGYADVLVGAHGYDNGQTDEGRAFLYLGSATGLAATAAWTAESDQATALFGVSLASAGDVNGDGFSDVLVGANQFDGGAADEGRAYLYLGNATGLAAAPAWTAESDQAGAAFGRSVAGAGDVNGDGYADVVAGANYYDNGQTNEGRAYLYLGSAAGLSATAAWTAEADSASAEFGNSVAAAGDVNGDGYADVVVAAYLLDNGQTDEGRVYLYVGSATGLAPTAVWTVESEQVTGTLGTAVASAGDVNGDGFADVVVGANEWNAEATDEGRAWVFMGFAAGPPATAAWTGESDQMNARFGYSVASAGDVNGDGFGDVIVGAYEYDNGETDEGRAYLYLGSATGLATTAAWTAESDQASAAFGYSVASAGDVNGDGFGDVVVGAVYYDNGQLDEGRASLYLGSATGLSMTAAWTTESDQAGAFLGVAVASAGDVNGDGYGDVVVGAPYHDNGQTDEGRAWVYLGSATGLSATVAWTAESDQASADFGRAVASAGDVNGDGYADVLVSASQFDNGQTDEGRAFLYLGSATGLALSAAWTTEADQVGAQLGASLASAGDVNRDGYGDVVVGANAYDNGQAEEGRAFLYLGSASGLAATAAWTSESNQAGGYFGTSVAAAGDVNGDGFGDVVVGSHVYDNGQVDEGLVSAYLGTATGLAASPAREWDSGQASAQIGISVASAGDVNGDGFGDVIAAAPHYDGPDTNEGRAWLYLGGDGAPGLARGLGQFDSPAGTTRIGIGTGTGNAVWLKGRVTQEGAVGALLRLEVEVKSIGTPFTGAGTVLSAPVVAGSIAGANVFGLSGAYHWRARVVYPVGSGHGRWVAFGGNGEADVDFRVNLTANGGGCGADAQCASGICEGVCCAVACAGVCNRCVGDGSACGLMPADDPACGVIDCDGLDGPCRDYDDLTTNRCDAVGVCEVDNGPACTVFTDLSGPCSDGSACTSGDTCSSGACTGTPIVCDDTNGCTDDSCNPASGCVFTNNTTACDDASECTTGDACLGGACVGSTIVCDDTNECTTDSCDTATGCVFTNNAMSCDDGDDCTSGDVCSGGACMGTGMCDAGVPDAGIDAGAGDDAGNPGDAGTDAAMADAAVLEPDAGATDEDGFYACDCRVASGRAPAVPAWLLLGGATLFLIRRTRRGGRR